MSLKEDPNQSRNAVRFTNEADLSSSVRLGGLRDPEESKSEARKAIEAAIAGQHADDGDRGRWPKAKDIVPAPDWKESENAMGKNESEEQRTCPDALGEPSEPNPGYAWVPGETIPTQSGVPSADQCWDICFFRTGRHMSLIGSDSTMASKVSRMIAKDPMKANGKGSEGWSFAGVGRFGFSAYGPKGKLSLRGDCAGHEPAEAAFPKAFLKAHEGESQREATFATMEGRQANDQFTQISGRRSSGWCLILTTDNTFATKIRKAAKGHPGSWVCWRIRGGTLAACCPKGCVGFRS